MSWPFRPIGTLKPNLMPLKTLQKQLPHCSLSRYCCRISWSATMWRRFLKFRPTNTTHLHLKADSSLCRQKLIADGQFSGSLGSCYTSFWHLYTVACLSLLSSCTHATDCAFTELQRVATAQCHKSKIHLWKQVKELRFTTDLSMAETIGKHGCGTANKKAKL